MDRENGLQYCKTYAQSKSIASLLLDDSRYRESDIDRWRLFCWKQILRRKLNQPIDWLVEVPGSEEHDKQALLIGGAADGTYDVRGVLFVDDSRNFLALLQSLGFAVHIDET